MSKKIFTFPRFGFYTQFAEELFRKIGFNVLSCPPITKKTYQVGTSLCDELVCFPMKVTLGNMVESLEKGATDILLVTTEGFCRFRSFGYVQREILKRQGYEFRLHILSAKDPVKLLYQLNQLKANESYDKPPTKELNKLKKQVDKLKRLNKSSNVEINKIFKNKFDISVDISSARPDRQSKNKQSTFNNPTSIPKNWQVDMMGISKLKYYDTTKQFNKEINHFIDNCGKIFKNLDLKVFANALIEAYNKIVKKEQEPQKGLVKILILGEFYTCVEETVNMFIEKKLKKLGAVVINSLSVAEHLREFLKIDEKDRLEKRKAKAKAEKLFPSPFGGHANQNLTDLIYYAGKVDGVINLYPMPCMPSTTIKKLLDFIASDHKLPLMHIVLDDNVSEGGIDLRLESFMEALKWRKNIL